MGLWRRTVLPAVAAVVATTVLAACANGGGLRVEGPESPPPAASATPTPSVALGTGSPSPSLRRTPEVTVDLYKVRARLLADRRLTGYARTVLSNCTVISRCLSRGKTVDVLHSGTPQQIVLIHTLEKFVFGIFLIAVEPAGPRPIWNLNVEQPTVNASPQGDLVVESKIFTINDPVCCPSGRRVEVYRWNGRQMIKVSSTDQ
ncbi:hypothetical protein [Kribbella shirazensis]|uniref:LppP/LprE family lipoprotein n=1 Tax=Kribbella shirazensis TaxID=1105143 RepID=A0A7X5VJ74_9ACTN|nr:hypothetical protein [Kribbella shirazensis]NIK61816.1 hypothetical protein [Kribbella shirazensis]